MSSSWRLRIALAALALVMSAGAIYVGPISQGHGFLQKLPPQWARWELARTSMLVVAGAAAMLALRPSAVQGRAMLDDFLTPMGFGVVHLATVVIAVIAIAVMATNPYKLYDIVTEMSYTEGMSEAMIAVSVVVMAASAYRIWGKSEARVAGLSASAVLALMTLCLFALLMEETSFGQHWLGFSTPEGFEGNLQHETNLHNFATHKVELVFYSAAIVAFVVLPFAWPANPAVQFASLSWYVPPPAFAVLGAGTAAFMFGTFAIVPLQAAFFVMLALLVSTALRAQHRRISSAAWITLALLLLSQVVILNKGPGLKVGYEPDEIRELQIALMIFVYTLWIRRKAWALAPRVGTRYVASDRNAKA